MTASAHRAVLPPADCDVLRADACDLLAGLRDVPLIIADPPYGIGYHSNRYVGRNPHAPVAGDWNVNIGQFIAAATAALKDGGALYLFSRWDALAKWMPYIVPPMKAKTCIVWAKDNWSAGDLRGCYGNQWEAILFAVKGRHLLRSRRWSNVWTIPRVPASRLLNPTEKPVALLERIVAASSDPGDLVADPFCGSGSTGVAAVALGRRFLLGDIDPAQVRLARMRLGLGIESVADHAERPATTAGVLATCPECNGHGLVPGPLEPLPTNRESAL